LLEVLAMGWGKRSLSKGNRERSRGRGKNRMFQRIDGELFPHGAINSEFFRGRKRGDRGLLKTFWPEAGARRIESSKLCKAEKGGSDKRQKKRG